MNEMAKSKWTRARSIEGRVGFEVPSMIARRMLLRSDFQSCTGTCARLARDGIREIEAIGNERRKNNERKN
jgi:hypothetical protein